MKILLTGSSGFLGKFICEQLNHENEIFELSRNSCTYKCSLDKEIPSFNHSFDLVIHAAGKAHSVPKTETQKKEFYNVNVLGTKNLLKGLENSTIPKEFVFISSVAVYGQEIGKEIDENFILGATDPYGLSKIEAEKVVSKWCKERNVICTILRLPLLVGENAPGNLGSMVSAIDKGYYFNVAGGKARKSMVLAKDVASIIIKGAKIGGTYNLTDGCHPTFNDLSAAISINMNKKKPKNLSMNLALFIGKFGDFFGKRAPINTSKVRKMTSDLTFNDNKAKMLFDWKPQSVIDYINNNKI
ncbi:NAD-dependent epimerase/dehydratase family protein [Flavobacterium sp. KACC 22763]|uniref:NAD-dependent epimerase/dehydratase family protein n=1 Tax=Flavobacterium sp. KACC 22763 TaxID=3025668 RepID=UPI0023651F11|nr:NAD-dependent epimerase/dehydratase family protein [Flavobacterium sp. KACC 22763]WDF62890.1 NAD-dependent epimerase/dehydratase family protein [Flavobacterium sp. KACC 22763]